MNLPSLNPMSVDTHFGLAILFLLCLFLAITGMGALAYVGIEKLLIRRQAFKARRHRKLPQAYIGTTLRKSRFGIREIVERANARFVTDLPIKREMHR